MGLVRVGSTAVALAWTNTAGDAFGLRWSRWQIPPRPWVAGNRAMPHPSICDIEASAVPRGAAIVCDAHHLVGLDVARGTWHRLPASPEFLPRSVTWTGNELLAFGDDHLLALVPRG